MHICRRHSIDKDALSKSFALGKGRKGAIERGKLEGGQGPWRRERIREGTSLQYGWQRGGDEPGTEGKQGKEVQSTAKGVNFIT